MPSPSLVNSLRARLVVGAALLSVGSLALAAAPVISGKPYTTSVKVGSWWSFAPTASDADGDKLWYYIQNKPTWLNFDQATGRVVAQPKVTGTWSNIIISVSDGTTRVSAAPFSITVWGGTTNTAPTISGTPSKSATVGAAYSFQPTASDANGDTLGFTIQNKPSWASFSTSTGRLSGTPSAAATHSSIIISVSDGKVTTALPAFAIAVTAGNRAPTISGTAAKSVAVNSAYSFRPTAADADGNALTFSIANRPAWATFSTTTGQLSGTPSSSHVGTYSNIVISVSDGKVTTSLPAFAVAVNQASIGAATLSWTPPTQNTDGTSLTNLAGYRIYYGTSSSALTQMVQVSTAGVSSYVIDNLAPSTYYFTVRAYTSAGTESNNSNVVSKIVQ
jgi:Putative Ig domain